MRRYGLLAAALLLGGCAAAPEAPDEGEAADSHAGAGLQLVAAERPEAARPRLERALELEPEHPQALTGLGLVAEAQGEPEAALEHHRRAAEAAPGSGAVLNNHGRALCRVGRIDEALEVLERAWEADGYAAPEVPATNAGRCAAGAERYEAAASWAERALEAEPDFAPALTLRGELRYRADRLDAAADDLAQAREADPEGGGPRSLYWSTRVAQARDEPEAAQRFREALVERFPESAQARRLLEAESAAAGAEGSGSAGER